MAAGQFVHGQLGLGQFDHGVLFPGVRCVSVRGQHFGRGRTLLRGFILNRDIRMSLSKHGGCYMNDVLNWHYSILYSTVNKCGPPMYFSNLYSI